MSTPSAFQVEPVAAGHGPELASLFERAECSCYCRYWHFQGTGNDWLARATFAPGDNRAEMLSALATGSDEMRGAVATTNGAEARVIGWVKVSPAPALGKLYAQRPYRNLPCFDAIERARVAAIGCFLVDPAWRGRGVARALVDGAVHIARSQGAIAIEAFPRRGELLRPDEIWTGPLDAFLDAGFETVHTFDPYPVLRKPLAPPQAPTVHEPD